MKKSYLLLGAVTVVVILIYFAFFNSNGDEYLTRMNEGIGEINSQLIANQSTTYSSDIAAIQWSICKFLRSQGDTYCTVSTERFVYEVMNDNFATSINDFHKYIKSLGFDVYNPSNRRLIFEKELYDQKSLDPFDGDIIYTKVVDGDYPIRYTLDFKLLYGGDCVNNISQNGDTDYRTDEVFSNTKLGFCTTVSAAQLIPGRIDWNTPNTSESDGPVKVDPIK